MDASAHPSLTEQQQGLKQAIVGQADVDGLLRIRPGREPLVRIYRHAYTSRLVAALRDNLGVLLQVMGDEAFDALAQAYLDAHPSQRPSIRWFGDQLADFMAAHDELVPHPAMTDVARMEWALRTAFDAADGESLPMTAWAAVPAEAWPVLVLEPLPSVQLLPLAWAVEPAWRALQGADGDPDDTPEMPEPQALPHRLLVWRQGLAVRWRSLDAPAAALLQAALRGETFAALGALASTLVDPDHAAALVAEALRGWAEDGLFSGWHTAEPATR